MAKKVTDLSALTSVATGDKIHIVDVSDTSQDPAGTSKYTTVGDIATAGIHASTSKATPVDADEIPLLDSAASFALKKLTWANIKATLKTYFDTLYSSDPNITYGMARQAIMNGNFDIRQRGPSFNLVDIVPIYTADRWAEYVNKNGGTLPTLTRTFEAATPGDIDAVKAYARLTTNGAGTSLGVNSQEVFQQKIENGTSKLCGLSKKVTVSFYARSSIANKRICPTLQQYYGTGGSPSTTENILGTPITLTSTWTKYTATFTTNTLVGKTFGTNNDDILFVDFYNMWGTTFGNANVQAGVTAETFVGSGNIDIAQVQLCAGDVALPFQPKSFEEELRACQRYYETGQGTIQMYATNTSQYVMHVGYRVTKRTTPTIVQTNVGNGSFLATPGNVNNLLDGFDSQRTANATAASSYWTETWTASAEL